MKEKRSSCQAVSIGPKLYVMGGLIDSTYPGTSSVEVFEISTYSLYPTDDNYVTVDGGYRSPKLLEHLCIDQFCQSLPHFGGDIPLGYSQYVVNAIVQSMVSHGAMNETTLKAFRNYDLD